MGKTAVINSKKKPSKPWWIYSYPAGWKKFTHRLKVPRKILQQREKFLNERIMSPTVSATNNQNKNVNLSPDMEIIKITTVVEAIRQKRQNSAQMLEVARNIQKIIGKKRSKRSSYELRNDPTVTKDSRHARQENTFVSSKKSRHPKPNYRKHQTVTPRIRKRRLQYRDTADLKTANTGAIPSTVFYKRIWEYINGTRPHSDITNGYGSSESNSENNNSTCTDKDESTALQEKLQVTSPNVKPERDFYKRIWDLINTTQLNGNAKARSKRNANIPESSAASTPLCVQEGAVNHEETKQVRATNEKTSLGITDTLNSPGISAPSPYIEGFWAVANKTQWQPKKIPIVNLVKLNNNPILSTLVNSASEVDDLNKFPDKVERVAYSPSDNSTEPSNEAQVTASSNSSQEIITEPGPPYSSEESFAISPTKNAINKNLQERDQVGRAENYSTGTTPNYDPSNIPYVDVPDYSDQQEDSLDKSNKSATAARYKEYDDGDYDYSPKQLPNADDFFSKFLSAEIKEAQAENNEPETSLNTNNSHSGCREDKDSAECIDNYNVEDTKLRNNTEDVEEDEVHRPAEDAAESEENENSDFVDFDINEYKKPINWDEFFKNDPILKSIRASKEYDYKENPDPTGESEEVETYATDPKENSYDYFAKDKDSRDDHEIALNNRNQTKEETDFYTKKETKESEIDKSPYPYDDNNFFKHIFGEELSDNDKKSEYNRKESPDHTEKFEEVDTTDQKEHKENPDRIEKSEEVETYTTDPRGQSQDYFVKNEDYYDNHKIAFDDKDKTDDGKEENDSYAKKETKESEIEEDPYDDEEFFKHIFGKDNDKESFDTVDTEKEFLSRHFTKDVLRQLRDNSTTEEDRQREKSRNREDIHKALSKILHKKDHFSRLDDNLNKMIEKGEAIPIKYNNFWSLEYESPGKRNKDNEEETENSKEEA